jgi:hypothetical protein
MMQPSQLALPAERGVEGIPAPKVLELMPLKQLLKH